MRIWLDACTGKHVRYATAIARELRARGHDVVLTTREHPDTVALAEALGEDFLVIGRYHPGDRAGKLLESARRMSSLARLFSDEAVRPDVAICHQSVELCRVAFGLGIPIVCTSDSPHAVAVGRLTIPLVDVLVISSALPVEPYLAMGARRIERFNGVDEVAWAKRPELSTGAGVEELLEGLERPIIVVREEEHGAAYARGRGLMWDIASALGDLGSVIFLPRYGRPPRLPEGMAVPEGFVDAFSLVGEADLVLGIGGTLCREAALQGTPAVVISYLGQMHVNAFLAEKGFPIFDIEPERGLGAIVRSAGELIGQKEDVRPLLAELEDPVGLIAELAESLAHG